MKVFVSKHSNVARGVELRGKKRQRQRKHPSTWSCRTLFVLVRGKRKRVGERQRKKGEEGKRKVREQ